MLPYIRRVPLRGSFGNRIINTHQNRKHKKETKTKMKEIIALCAKDDDDDDGEEVILVLCDKNQTFSGLPWNITATTRNIHSVCVVWARSKWTVQIVNAKI